LRIFIHNKAIITFLILNTLLCLILKIFFEQRHDWVVALLFFQGFYFIYELALFRRFKRELKQNQGQLSANNLHSFEIVKFSSPRSIMTLNFILLLSCIVDDKYSIFIKIILVIAIVIIIFSIIIDVRYYNLLMKREKENETANFNLTIDA